LNELAIGIAPPRGAYETTKLALTHRQMWKLGLGAELHDADAARELGMIDEVITVRTRAQRGGARNELALRIAPRPRRR